MLNVPIDLPALVLSALLAGTLILAVRRDVSPWILALLGLVPAITLYSLNPCLRIYSSHGLLHTGVVYQLLNGFVPPMNFYFGGEAQMYPWAHAVPVAAMVAVLNVSPGTGFAVLNTLAFALSLIVVYRIGVLITADRSVGVLAAFLSMFGVTCFSQGPVAYTLQRVMLSAFGVDVLETRALLPVKFVIFTGMPVGILSVAVLCLAMIRIFTGRGTPRSSYTMLTLAIVGAGYAYPLIWLGLLGCVALIVWLNFMAEPWTASPTSARVLIPVGLGCVIVLPYLLQLSAGKSGESIVFGAASSAQVSFVVFQSLGVVLLRSLRAAVFVLPIALLLLWQRETVRTSLRNCPGAALVLAGASLALIMAYAGLTVTPSLSNEYKFLLISSIPLGVLGGIAMRAVVRDRPLAGFALGVLFLLPIASSWVEHGSWLDCDLEIEEGAYLRSGDEENDALYQWIAGSTARDAIFLDSELEIPIFGRRQLYVAMGGEGLEGWNAAPLSTLFALQYPLASLIERYELAEDLYLGSRPLEPRSIAALRRMACRHDLYVVARNALVEGKLVRSGSFERVFSNDAASVFETTCDQPRSSLAR